MQAPPKITRILTVLAVTLALAGCALPAPVAPPREAPALPAATPSGVDLTDFAEVVTRARPAAEQLCREVSPHLNCNFLIVIDDRPGQPPNAFHLRDRRGRPVIGFTSSFLAEMRNADEIAMVLGHEAGHHIADHLPRLQREAEVGAAIGGAAAMLSGLDRESTREFVNAAALVRQRRYAQVFELEADQIGTLIAHRAGFDPRRGAGLLRRTPDPGNRFLATHPPSAERLRVIERTIARIEAGQTS